MLTADTITDEQIHEVRNLPEGHTYAREMLVCDALGVATGPCYRIPTADIKTVARARCADILNAHAKAGR